MIAGGIGMCIVMCVEDNSHFSLVSLYNHV